MGDSITRLYRQAQACRHDSPAISPTARLIRSGRNKVVQKFAEEAIEVVIDAIHGDGDAITKQSADLIYNLVVLWISADIRPEVVWKEMDRRGWLLSISEKKPKKRPGSARKKGRAR
ncbi:MAG: phosphoribosyl-ATP diphosphatase [Xanthobacteraceae bacterium]